MSSTTVGNLSAILTLQAEKFHHGLESAGDKLKEFSGIGEIMGAVIGGVSAIALAEMTHRGLENVEAMNKLSNKTGLSTEMLAGMKVMAEESGIAFDDVKTAMNKVAIELGNAKDGAKASVDAFARLGLSQAQLKSMKTDEVMSRVSDALASIADPTQKASLLTDLFGKKAMALMPILGSGSVHLHEASEEAEKLGLSFNKIEGAQVEAAMESFHKIGSVVEGVGQKLAIAVAPVLKFVVQKFIDWAESGGGVGKKVAAALEWIGGAVGVVIDSIGFLVGTWHLLEGGVQKGAFLVLSAIDALGQAIVKVANLIPGVNLKLTTWFKDTAQMYSKAGDASLMLAGQKFADALAGKGAAGVKATFAEMRKASEEAANQKINGGEHGHFDVVSPEQIANMEKAGKMLEDLTAKVANYGKTEAQVTAEKIRSLTTDKAMIAQADQLAARLQVLDEQKKHEKQLDEDAKTVLKDIQSPLDKYNEKLKELQELLQSNRINQEQFDKAKHKAGETLEKGDKHKLEALSVGSAASFRFLASAGRETVAHKQLSEQQIANHHLLAISTAVKTNKKQLIPAA